MKRFTLIVRSLLHYWRTHLGVLAGTVLTAALLTGALVVGDSVRYSLRQMAVARLGKIDLALSSGERFVRAALADEVAADTRATVAPVLLLRGMVSAPDQRRRANDVQVVGVESRFWKLGGASDLFAHAGPDEAVVNEQLARRLSVARGDRIIIRMEQPSFISRDAPLSGKADVSVVIRARVRAVAGDADFGRFGLAANQVAPLTVFVPLATAQERTKRDGRVNTLLVAGVADAARGNTAIAKHWTLSDVGVELRSVPLGPGVELRTDGVFLDPAMATAAQSLTTNRVDVLTYFVNELRCGENRTPYSMITAIRPGQTDFLPADLRDDEIVLNEWTATDLGVERGDDIAVTYYIVGNRRELREATTTFRLRAVVPLAGKAADPSWMPDYPGLSDAENCRDWEPGIPIDNTKIRPKDETYWKNHKGTPKAFITLAAGQKLWDNRFGNLTAIRYPDADKAEIERQLRAQLDPARFGLFFVPVREQALAASGQAMDFGQLFIGFSFFLIIAALLLTAMLFVFNLEQRNAEAGLLRAIGFGPGLVRRFFLLEGFVVAVTGTAVGVWAGTGYTRVTLHGLATVWKDAVGSASFQYHAEPATLALGGMASLLVALGAMWMVVRQQARQAPAALLAGRREMTTQLARKRVGLWIGIGFVVIAAVALWAALGKGQSPQAAEYFFMAGMSLLIAGLGFSQRLLVELTQTTRLARRIATVGLRNAARRPGRSLATAGVLASGVFLVVAVNAFRRDPLQSAWERSSGTGGFALWAQSSLPVYEDLNQKSGRDAYNLSVETMRDVAVVPLRMREGDDASCLNLNRAQQPRIWGVAPAELAQRGAFTFTGGSGWETLAAAEPGGVIPAIGDQQTVTWALGKKLGDVLTITDDYGHECRLKIVAVTAPSILQGGLLVAEEHFVRHFPMSAGYRAFLVDAPRDRLEAVRDALSRGLEDKGLELVPAAHRLAEFLAVENTYLAIFQVLGGLGLLLGSLGLAIVVLRNVMERRGELALMQAVGFPKSALHRLVLSEHWLLILLGVGCGVGAAVLAVLPAWGAPGAEVPVPWIVGTVIALAVGSMVWCWIAALAVLRGSLLASLRNE